MVRAKFRVSRYETSIHATSKRNPETGAYEQERRELRTIYMQVVTSGSDENVAFFGSTPSGEIKLGTINESAWREFALETEHYVDFTRAET